MAKEKIYYSRASQGNLHEYPKVIAQIKERAWKSLRWEKLQSKYNIYSVRADDQVRILFTRRLIKNVSSLVFVAVLEHHEYNRFLKQFIPDCGENVQDPDSYFSEMPEEELIPVAEAMEGLDPTVPMYPVEWYRESFIQLDPDQDRLIHIKPPMVINGGAGSGKTCLAEVLMREHLARSPNPSEEKILYIAHSWRLVNKIAQDLADLTPNVEFKTWFQFLQENGCPVTEENVVGKKDFIKWLPDYLNTLPSKHAVKKKKLFARPSQVYSECMLISGYEDANAYHQLGKKQTRIPAEHRHHYWSVYAAYLEKLNQEGKIDPSFFKLTTAKRWTYMVVDEAQDFFGKVLEILYLSVRDGQVVWLKDNYQNLIGSMSNTTFLCGLVARHGLKLMQEQMAYSRRCPLKVTNVINAVIEMRLRFAKGVDDKNQFQLLAQSENGLGSVHWLSPTHKGIDIILDDLRDRVAKNCNFVVITEEGLKKEAKERFQTDEVYTEEEYKGLEGAIVLLYHPFVDPIFVEMGKKLGPLLARPLPKNRAKKGEECLEEDEPYLERLSRLIVMLSRTTSDLIIYGDHEAYGLDVIINYMKQANGHFAAEETVPLSLSYDVQESSPGQWLSHCEKLLENGNEEHARRCYLKHVVNDENQFEELCKNYRKKLLVKPVIDNEKKDKDDAENEKESKENNNNNDVKLMEELLANPTKKLILEFLEKSDFVLLLDKEMPNHFFYIEKLFQVASEKNVFRDKMVIKKFKDKWDSLTNEERYKLFYHQVFFENKFGLEQFSYIMQSISKKKITELSEILCGSKFALLPLCTADKHRIAVFHEEIDKNLNLKFAITIEGLYFRQLKGPLLDNLLKHQGGELLLTSILRSNTILCQDLLIRLTEELLTQKAYQDRLIFNYYISLVQQSKNVEYIVKNRPDLISKIKVGALWDTQDPFTMQLPIICFLNEAENFLQALFDHNPTLEEECFNKAKKMPSDLLFQNQNEKFPTPFIYYFAKSALGCEFLQSWYHALTVEIEKSGEPFPEIETHNLMKTKINDQDALDQLLDKPEGLRFLTAFIKGYPKVRDFIVVKLMLSCRKYRFDPIWIKYPFREHGFALLNQLNDERIFKEIILNLQSYKDKEVHFIGSMFAFIENTNGVLILKKILTIDVSIFELFKQIMFVKCPTLGKTFLEKFFEVLNDISPEEQESFKQLLESHCPEFFSFNKPAREMQTHAPTFFSVKPGTQNRELEEKFDYRSSSPDYS